MGKIRFAVVVLAGAQGAKMYPDLRQLFLTTAIADGEALDTTREALNDRYAGMVLDLLRFMRPPSLV